MFSKKILGYDIFKLYIYFRFSKKKQIQVWYKATFPKHQIPSKSVQPVRKEGSVTLTFHPVQKEG